QAAPDHHAAILRGMDPAAGEYVPCGPAGGRGKASGAGARIDRLFDPSAVHGLRRRHASEAVAACDLIIRHCEERSDEAIHSAASGVVDCFAEPVIGPAQEGRTRWLAMTNYPGSTGPPAFFQASMPPAICAALARPASLAACTAIAERSPKAQKNT